MNFVEEAARWGFPLTEQQQGQFAQYLALLLAWNERLNLTAIRDPAGIELRHFLDSLTCATVTGNLDQQKMIDIGSGAGFPGLPLKILYPTLQLTLVDSVAKKCHFLQTVANELGLNGVKVISGRAEELGQMTMYREQYDWALARGVAELRILAEYLLPFCQPGGHALAQKGPNPVEEVAASDQALQKLGGGRPTIYPVQLPGREQPHSLIVIKKIANTPANYPRRPGIPAKRPL